jgi:hypothetical protein
VPVLVVVVVVVLMVIPAPVEVVEGLQEGQVLLLFLMLVHNNFLVAASQVQVAIPYTHSQIQGHYDHMSLQFQSQYLI